MKNLTKHDDIIFSIIIVTYNRANVLEELLKSLYYLNYNNFEVIVIYGPCNDNTVEILEKYKDDIKIAHCSVANISIARNIGIAMACGDYIAFIDDDAIPSSNWLNHVLLGFDSEEVAAVGGDVIYYSDGVTRQYRKIVSSRFGYSKVNGVNDVYDVAVYPHSFYFYSTVGVNSIFKRKCLLEIGGFDEQYEYYLDETDVCARLTDKGYIINYVENAIVYHKEAPSDIRNAGKALITLYPIVKNNTYFIKQYEPIIGENATNNAICNYINEKKNHVFNCYKDKTYLKKIYLGFLKDIENGLKQGILDAKRGPLLLTQDTLNKYKCDYKKFPNYKSILKNKKTIVFLTHEYLPNITGGICMITYELATYMAKLGHNVHVFTPNMDECRHNINLEENVWVHRLPNDNLSYNMCQELLCLSSVNPVDIVQSFLWENLCYDIIKETNFKSVVTLVTPAIYFSNGVYNESLEREKFIMENNLYLTSDSEFIYNYCKEFYPNIQPNKKVIYLGLKDKNSELTSSKSFKKDLDDEQIEILFLSRLEERKGVDLLFKCIPDICKLFPNVIFRFVGKTDSKMHNSRLTYKNYWEKKHKNMPYFNQVIFEGRVDDTSIYYKNCDIFVHPARFESFGLIFLEAMMFSKPVVAFNVSAISEVVEHNVTGLLATKEDVISLKDCLIKLIKDKALRLELGKNGRQRYEKYFMLEKTANNYLQFYDKILNNTGV